MSEFPSLSGVNNIPLYAWSTFVYPFSGIPLSIGLVPDRLNKANIVMKWSPSRVLSPVHIKITLLYCQSKKHAVT